MGKNVSDSIGLFLTVLGVFYGLIGLLLFVPSIRDFFFQNQVHIGVFLLLVVFPLLIMPIVLKQLRISMGLMARAIGYFFGVTVLGYVRHYWRVELVLVLVLITLGLLYSNLQNPFTISLVLIYFFLFIMAFESTRKHREPEHPWIYDFYEHYSEAIQFRMPEHEQHKPEMSGNEVRRALWAQPPPNSSGYYLYKVLLPEKISRLELSFWIGIRDEVRGTAGDTNVRFQINVNNVIVFDEEYGEKKWRYNVVSLKSIPGSEITLMFVTKTAGRNVGYGAMWGEPALKAFP